jgi:hypothetical protein
MRPSDVAWGHYISVAKRYESLASFFVVPAAVGSDVARTYSVPGNPSLLHFRLGTRNGILNGFFSRDSVERFVANWTSSPLIPFAPNVTTEGDFWQAAEERLPNRTLAVVVFGDNTTKFGRSALELADELGPYFPFLGVRDAALAKLVQARFPSVVLFRFEDRYKAAYTDEPDVDDMFIWAQHNSVPGFRNLDAAALFSPDGVSQRSVIVFVNRSRPEDIDGTFPVIGKYSSDQRWIKFWYADVTEQGALANLFGITQTPSVIYLAANYTHLSFAKSGIDDNAMFTAFFDEVLPLKAITTPRQMYGSMRTVTEFAFEKMADEGPFFTLFTSAFCVKCKNLKQATIDAVDTLVRYGAELPWAFWDVTIATPSFQKNNSIGIPSIWYFTSANVSEGVAYAGQPNFLSIIEWAHGRNTTAFNLDGVIRGELGGGFDDI